MDENAEYLARLGQIIRKSGRFQRNMLDMVNGLRGYLLTNKKHFIDNYDSAVRENIDILNELPFLLVDSSQKKILFEINNLHDKWVEEYTDPLKQAKSLAGVNDSNLIMFNKMYKEKFISGHEKASMLNFNRSLEISLIRKII